MGRKIPRTISGIGFGVCDLLYSARRLLERTAEFGVVLRFEPPGAACGWQLNAGMNLICLNQPVSRQGLLSQPSHRRPREAGQRSGL
jgi:hypothetical protein